MRWLKLALLVGPCVPMFGSSIDAVISSETAAATFALDMGPLTVPGSSPFVSTAVITGNLDRWYSPYTLPVTSAGTPQEVLLANVTATVQPLGSGLAGFDTEYIAMLEAQIVSGGWSWVVTPAISVISAASVSPVTAVAVSQPIAAVPEPGTLVLLGGGVAVFAFALANRGARALRDQPSEGLEKVWPDI